MGGERADVTVTSSEAKSRLAEARAAFRAQMERAKAPRVWQSFSGSIGVVLPGGGARGAYEAGILLAFQDADLPTHIITATSIGSINAAGYAAHSTTLVGNAEPIVESWFELTPTAAGIEWTRYAWMLGGLIAAAAGFGNLLSRFLSSQGFSIHLHNPGLTWFALGLAGTAVSLLHDQLPYLAYVVRNWFRRTSWQADRRKTALSLLANLVVWGFLILVVDSLHIHSRFRELITSFPWATLLTLVVVGLLVALHKVVRPSLSTLLHRFLRLPLRAGLFHNFERGRILRQRISSEGLRASPIRVVLTVTDLEAGTVRYISNAPPESLAALPGADTRFALEEVTTSDDLVRAVIASSALPIVYEPITLEGRVYIDGATATTQPTRPAIRLGADVLFVVMMEPPGRRPRETRTFVDIGLRALDILMSQNLHTDLKVLSDINAACERAAADIGARPEEVEIDLGTRRLRYVKPFTIRPDTVLAGTVLDFGRETIGADLLRGYRDAGGQIEAFLAYALQARFDRPKRVLQFAPERDPSRSA
jgi:predicted acylesterase/phospholipase RssA